MNQKGVIAHLFLITILAVGIIVGVYIIQKQQIFKSKASANPILDAFEIKDSNGSILNCDGSTNPPICTTSTLDVLLRIKNLDALISNH